MRAAEGNLRASGQTALPVHRGGMTRVRRGQPLFQFMGTYQDAPGTVKGNVGKAFGLPDGRSGAP